MRRLLLFFAAFSCCAQQGTLTLPGASGPVAVELKHNGVTHRKLLNGPSTLPLDAGVWSVRLTQGPHYRPVEREVVIRNGETVDFGTSMPQLVVDLPKFGWFGGSISASDADTSATGLDWTAVVPGQTHFAKDGRIGGIGPVAALPSNFAQLPSYEALGLLRDAGAVTLATSRHRGLPLDLVAAGLVDGLVLTDDGDRALTLWSLLLDHGYPVAAMPGAGARIYVPCPAGFSAACLQDAIRHKRTVVSTGPILTAVQTLGKQIEVNAWPRQDRPDRLLRIELWAHNRVIATREMSGVESQHFAGALTWTPNGPNDWITVRAISHSGWALSSAFFAEEQKPAPPTSTHVKIVLPEIASQQQADALATVWNFSPGLPGARRVKEIEMERNEVETDAPVTAVVRIELADGRQIDLPLPEASGVNALLRDSGQDEALLQWSVYEEVLRRCRRISVESRF